MFDIIVARSVHVLAVVIWIGGVCMVTTVLLPTIKQQFPLTERLKIFHKIERRFSAQACFVTLLTGLSGFYMVWRLQVWNRFESLQFWWMHAMFFVWLIFTVMLFILEPLFLDKKLHLMSEEKPEQTYQKIQWLHWFLLLISIITIIGAVMGSNGY